MTVYCDACEHEVGKGLSKCCGADVWGVYRQDEVRHLCQECGNDCEIVPETVDVNSTLVAD